MQVLGAMADGWHSRRDKLRGSADYIVATLAGQDDAPSEAAPASVLERHARILSGWREAAAPEPREKEKRAAAPTPVEEPKLWPAQEAGSLMA